MEHNKISRLVRISPMVTKRVTVITMRHYKVGICTFWGYWQIRSVFNVVTTVFIVRIHHKKSSDIVIGLFLLRLEFRILVSSCLILESDVVSSVGLNHPRSTGDETLCWKVARIWQTICEVKRCLPNILWWKTFL